MRARSMLLAAALLAGAGTSFGAQPLADRATVPFVVGEELVFHANLGRFRARGRAVMRVDSEELRGRSTYVFRFDLKGRVVGMGVEDHTQSWLDQRTVATLRFTKRERSPLTSVTEEVDLYPEEGIQVVSGDTLELATDAPLDELSFMYFIRTLPLADGEEYTFDRHFDPARNPTRVRVVGRERITVPAGEFSAIVVEMLVRDVRRYDGEGTVRIHLTDDDRRIPLRISSRMRGAGATTLSLETIGPAALAGR